MASDITRSPPCAAHSCERISSASLMRSLRASRTSTKGAGFEEMRAIYRRVIVPKSRHKRSQSAQSYFLFCTQAPFG